MHISLTKEADTSFYRLTKLFALSFALIFSYQSFAIPTLRTLFAIPPDVHHHHESIDSHDHSDKEESATSDPKSNHSTTQHHDAECSGLENCSDYSHSNIGEHLNLPVAIPYELVLLDQAGYYVDLPRNKIPPKRHA